MNEIDDHDDELQEGFPSAEDGNAGEDLPVAVPGELTPAAWPCAACGQANETLVDLSSGYKQQYVEDCAVCCRPNLITLAIEETGLRIFLRNELE